MCFFFYSWVWDDEIGFKEISREEKCQRISGCQLIWKRERERDKNAYSVFLTKYFAWKKNDQRIKILSLPLLKDWEENERVFVSRCSFYSFLCPSSLWIPSHAYIPLISWSWSWYFLFSGLSVLLWRSSSLATGISSVMFMVASSDKNNLYFFSPWNGIFFSSLLFSL